MESLYRKYRPQTFADVVGQQHVVGTLQRAVMEGRTSHAYLFCGPRGTGKTTMARLLAKSLMCEEGPGHLPDGTCEQCTLIAAGEHPDVYELDAASRTGVDNVREEIITRVGYAPVRGRYKVYIIDEVHMLTTAAFNALLKTLEEPPDHVVFVLCTTDPQKIPATILSRVQRFDFRPISSEDIRERLVFVCQRERFAYEDAALDLVVRHARGGMRDALSTLEQLSVFGDGTVSAAAAQDLLGAVPGAEMNHVVDALAARDVPMLFLQVGELVESGRDPLQFARELAAHMRDVYVVSLVGARPEVLDSSVDVERLQQEAQAFGSADRISRVLTILGDAMREMTTAPNQRLVLEIAFTRMARPVEDLTLESLAERLAELERKVKSGAVGQASQPVPVSTSQPTATQAVRVGTRPEESAPQPEAQPARPAPTEQPPATPQHAPAPARPAAPQPDAPQAWRAPQQVSQPVAPQTRRVPQQAPQQVPQQAPAQSQPAAMNMQPSSPAISDAGELRRRWRQVTSELLARLPSRGSLLSNATPISDDGRTLTVGLPKGSNFAFKMLERPDVRAAVEGVVAEYFGPRTMAYREGMGQSQRGVAAPAPSVAPAPAPAAAPNRVARSAQESRATVQQPGPTPNVAPQAPAYPMPWDAPASMPEPAMGPVPEDPGPDYVPYEELGTAYVEPESEYAPTPTEPPTPTSAPATTPTAPPDDVPPASPATAPTTQPVAAPQVSEPSSQTEPSAPQRSVPEAPDDLPPELAAILANAFEVFGEDVRVKRG